MPPLASTAREREVVVLAGKRMESKLDRKNPVDIYGPMTMCDIFISYSHQDVALAEQLEEYLKSQGLDTWRDVRLAPGVKFEGEIKEHLESARICLFLMSQASLSSE